MNTIHQHIPRFCDGFEPEVNSFSSHDEMLNIAWVKKWSDDKRFRRYSLSGNNLMAEYRDGKFYVIGNISHVDDIDLPKLAP